MIIKCHFIKTNSKAFHLSNFIISITINNFIKSNTTGATSGAGTAYLSGAPEFTYIFLGVRVE